jgi:hypothetical protein
MYTDKNMNIYLLEYKLTAYKVRNGLKYKIKLIYKTNSLRGNRNISTNTQSYNLLSVKRRRNSLIQLQVLSLCNYLVKNGDYGDSTTIRQVTPTVANPKNLYVSPSIITP